MVWILARSRRACPTRAGFLATPIESWKRRLKSSSASSLPFWVSSSSDISRHFVAFMVASERPRAGYELGLDAELLCGEPKPVLGRRLVHTLHLVEDASRLDHRHPELGVALPLAHPRLRGLLGHRLVGEDPDEDLAAALDTSGQGDSRGLDLPVGHPRRLQGLEPVVTEGEGGPAMGLALHAPALGLPVLDALGHQHGIRPRPSAGWAGPRP